MACIAILALQSFKHLTVIIVREFRDGFHSWEYSNWRSLCQFLARIAGFRKRDSFLPVPPLESELLRRVCAGRLQVPQEFDAEFGVSIRRRYTAARGARGTVGAGPNCTE